MNTITIDNNIYNWAESYAKMHNITLKELAEKALMMVVKKKRKVLSLKAKKNFLLPLEVLSELQSQPIKT